MFRFFACLFIFLASASALSAQERQWSFDQTDKDAYLVFGVPETDDVGLSFWCTQRSGRIKIFVPEGNLKLKPKEQVQVRFDVAAKTFRLKATAEANKEASSASLETEVPIDHPIFSALANADRITVRVKKRQDVFPTQDLDLSALLQVCKATQG
jgi:hypothetical protein